MQTNNRKVNKYLAHPGALVWVNIKNKWRQGVIFRLVRSKVEISYANSEDQMKTISVEYTSLLFRKLGEAAPPKELI